MTRVVEYFAYPGKVGGWEDSGPAPRPVASQAQQPLMVPLDPAMQQLLATQNAAIAKLMEGMGELPLKAHENEPKWAPELEAIKDLCPLRAHPFGARGQGSNRLGTCHCSIRCKPQQMGLEWVGDGRRARRRVLGNVVQKPTDETLDVAFFLAT